MLPLCGMHLVLDGIEGRPYKPLHKVRLLGGVPILGRGVMATQKILTLPFWVQIPTLQPLKICKIVKNMI